MAAANKTLWILLADDFELVRRGLQTVIEHEPGWKICGIACAGPEAVAKARRLRPDIVVADLEMPGKIFCSVADPQDRAVCGGLILFATRHSR